VSRPEGAGPSQSISSVPLALRSPWLTCAIIPAEEGRRNGGVTEDMTEDLSGAGRGAGSLLERERELAELDSLLAEAREARGRMALIEGPAGIGKSRLLGVARERAVARDMNALLARGGELERDFGFGIVRQLLEPVLSRAAPDERESLLAGAAGLSEPVFATRPGEGEDAGDPTHAVLHGLYWLVANLAERSPLLLAIDDVHWADPPSLRFLHHLVPRLEGLATAIVICARTGEEGDGAGLLAGLKLDADPVLRPGPLSRSGVAGLVRAELGAEATDELCAACHGATRGNAFLVTELLHELDPDRSVVELDAREVPELGSQRVATAVLMRVGRISASAPALARALAVLGEGAEIGLAAEIAGLGDDDARALTAALADAAVLEPGEPLRFLHPLVRAAIYGDTPAPERDALHARAARLLRARGAEPEAIAVHLLASTPEGDSQVVTELRTAATEALKRGAPESASRYLRRALTEPPPPELEFELLLELGVAAGRAGDADASRFLNQAHEAADTREQRATAALALARLLAAAEPTFAEAARIYASGAGELGDVDSPLRWRLEAYTIVMAQVTASIPAVVGRQRAIESEFDGLPRAAKQILASPLSVQRAVSGESAAEAIGLAEMALRGGLLTQLGPSALFHQACETLIYCGRPADAERQLDRALEQARGLGSTEGLAVAAAIRSVARWRQGRLRDGESDARLALDLVGDEGWHISHYYALASLVSVCVARGELDEAGAVLQVRAAIMPGESDNRQLVREAEARLLLARGDPRGALEELGRCADWAAARVPSGNGLAPVAWRSLTALAHARLEDPETGLELAHEEVEMARRFGNPCKLGVALRAEGQLESGARRLELLAEGVEVLAASQARLEYAAGIVELGTAQLRTGHRRQARETLAQGMDLAHRCGADALVERAHDELIQAGARPRRRALTGVDALTPSELRVAEMAAEGMANKEIAQALFVTLRTVEMHLSNAYSKLEIGSRRELAGALEI
jgi:DNA-binding CsgD family transcriptional regulator